MRCLPTMVARYKTSTMVTMDMTLHIPFLYFPVFYCMKELIVNETVLSKEHLSKIVTVWRTNLVEDLRRCWSFWVPVQCVTFSIVPMHLRVPFVSVVNFIWTCFLSATRGS